MIPLIVMLPLIFAFLIIISNYFDIKPIYRRGLFLGGVSSPWLIFLHYLDKIDIHIVIGGWERISGIELALDSYNYYMVLGGLLLFSLGGIYIIKYFDIDRDNEKVMPSKSIYPLILILQGSILGTFLTRDIFNFFVYMEISSVASVILVACSSEKGAKIASFRYLMMYFLSTFFFLFAIGIIYVKTGHLNYHLISQSVEGIREIKVAILLAILALMLKAGIFPLFFWLPEAYTKADHPVTSMLAGMGGKAQLFGMVLILLFLPLNLVSEPLKILALSSMLFGAVLALFQTDIKKIFAYSSMSQMGYILLAISLIEAMAAIYHSFVHALSIGGMFLLAGILIKSGNSKHIEELTYRKKPLVMGTCVVLSLSLMGVYPFMMSYSKKIMVGHLSGYWTLLFYAVSVGTVMVYVRLNYHLLKKGESAETYQFSFMKIFPPLVFALTMLVGGIYLAPEFALTDFITLLIGTVLFLVLNHIGLFKLRIPEPFSKDYKGLAKEINYYTMAFISVVVVVLFYVLY
ncbi:MAG: proton-conducting transporter membrane subunit [Candidatus Saliniplasma sp.]